MRETAAAVALLVAVFMGTWAACSIAIILKRVACLEWRQWRVRRMLREVPTVAAGRVSERWVRHEGWKQGE